MNYGELLNHISRDTGISNCVADRVLQSMGDTIRVYLGNREEVNVKGLGKFKPQFRAARTGRNPHTREAVPIPERTVPAFVPCQNLRDFVNNHAAFFLIHSKGK